MDGTSLEDAYNNMYMGGAGSFQTQSQQVVSQPQQSVVKKSTPIGDLRSMQQAPKEDQQQMVVSRSPLTYDPTQVPVQQISNAVALQPYYPPAYAVSNTSKGYFDSLVTRKRDVLKMVAIAVIILLAMSIHHVVDFGLKEFIMSNDFTFKQELGFRVLYPFAVLFVLWNIKALTSSR